MVSEHKQTTVKTNVKMETILYREATIEIHPDHYPENPMEEWSEMGKIYSFSKKHINSIDLDRAEELMTEKPHHVKLSYFEHGSCHWMVMGESSPGMEFRWDGVRFAGLWIPDDDCMETINARAFKGMEERPGTTFQDNRRKALLDYARDVCKTYTHWCNGDVYGYTVELDGDQIDSCYGFYGSDLEENGLLGQAQSVIDGHLDDLRGLHLQKLKEQIKHKVPLEYRKPLKNR